MLNQLPIVEYSSTFSNIFNMDGRRNLVEPPEPGVTVNPSSPALRASREEWYTTRYEDLEHLSSYELLQEYEGPKYARIDLTSAGARKLVPQYSPCYDCAPPPDEPRLEAARRISPDALAKVCEKSERYAEQRLVMFKPYRQRERDLKGNAPTWMQACLQYEDSS